MVKRRRPDWWDLFPFWRERREWSPFDEFLSDIEEDMRRIEEQFDSLFRKAAEGELPPPEKGGPYVYGFTLRMGPDGKPKIEQFGTAPMLRREAAAIPSEIVGSREPMTDIIEKENEMTVTVEMPGVEKEDIDLQVTENSVIIKADSEDRRYFKEIELPRKANPDKVEATYKNGVLDVRIPLEERPEKKGKRIDIS